MFQISICHGRSPRRGKKLVPLERRCLAPVLVCSWLSASSCPCHYPAPVSLLIAITLISVRETGYKFDARWKKDVSIDQMDPLLILHCNTYTHTHYIYEHPRYVYMHVRTHAHGQLMKAGRNRWSPVLTTMLYEVTRVGCRYTVSFVFLPIYPDNACSQDIIPFNSTIQPYNRAHTHAHTHTYIYT